MAGESTTSFSLAGSVAVVTGSNKGIGFEICKQLAAKGIIAVLTARDEKRGLQALEKIKSFGYSDDLVVFHQLDVGNKSSVDSLANFIKQKFGKLDILINNAGVSGVVVENADSYMEIIQNHLKEISKTETNNAAVSMGVVQNAGVYMDHIQNYVKENSQTEEKKEILEKAEENESDTYEWAEQCLETNYFGLKRVTEALLPLLLLSESPRIVNVSSPWGMLKNLSNKWAIGVLSNVEELTVEKEDEVVSEYLKDRKDGSFVAKGWPRYFSAYKLSKAVVNGYTRILAKKYPEIVVSAVDPGFVATELTHNLGYFTAEEGAECPVKLALLPKEGPSGLFWERHEVGVYE